MSDDADRVNRWIDGGGHWVLVSRSASEVTLALRSCDGEEMSRIRSSDADLLRLVGDRLSSED